MRGMVIRTRRRLFAVLVLCAVLVCAAIVLAMLVIVMMPGVVAGQSLASVRVAGTSARAMRATTGAVSHGIVRQMAQRRGRRVEGQQPPADQIT